MRIVLLSLALAAAAPALAQSVLPPAQNLEVLENMVVATLGADVGQPGGPMAPIDRRMSLAACISGVQIDPPTTGAVTVRCPSAGWRLRVPLMRANMTASAGFASSTGPSPAASSSSAVRKGDPVQLVAQGRSYSISVDATAMEDADIGGRVRVATRTKGSTLFAEVVDVGRVRLVGFK